MDNTIATQLRKAASCLPADSARLDAELLLAHVLDKPRSWLLAWPEQEVSPAMLVSFEKLLTRRVNGEPIAYILGMQEFWSMPLHLTEATLIPRPDTEVLVEAVLNSYKSQEALKILDAGTGSGAIALALAKERPCWGVVASDISKPALDVARGNAERLGISVTFIQSDWLLAFLDNNLDIIVSNPPYIAENDVHLEHLRYEPRSALVAADTGLADIRAIVEQAVKALKSGGALYVEHGYDQGERVRSIFESGCFVNVHTGKDYAGNERFTCGIKP